MIQVQELQIDYTDCTRLQATNHAPDGTFGTVPAASVQHHFKSKNATSDAIQVLWNRTIETVAPDVGAPQEGAPVCTLQFTLPNDIGSPVYLYYRLTNFYQNHRRYVKSLDLDQLKGQFVDNNTIANSACNPLKTDANNIAIYPCGLIANSIFNDTIGSPTAVSSSGGQDPSIYQMSRKGIAWASDLQLYKQTAYNNTDVVPPPNWQKRFPNGYDSQHGIPNLSEYEEFAVWMRTAGLPTFSKLARRNDDTVMRAGTYTIRIADCEYQPLSLLDY